MKVCDICVAQFPNSTPNAARYDAPVKGAGGAWAFLCEAHKSYAVQSMLRRLKEQ